MTKVAILPVPAGTGETAYRAISGERQSAGKTAGEALDAMTELLEQDETDTLVVVQHRRPDRFFTLAQQQRLGELMERWRTARDAGTCLSGSEQAELDALVEAELRAATDRAAAVLGDLDS